MVAPDAEPVEPVEPVWPESEAERVGWWRYQTLRGAGFPVSTALVLADRTDVDLHVACELLVAGCDPETAWEILS